jgi:hypothetical protein
MKASFTSRKSLLSGRSTALAVVLAILAPIAPHNASAHGGTVHLWTAWSHVSRAETGTAQGVQYVWRPEHLSRIHPVSHAIVRERAH